MRSSFPWLKRRAHRQATMCCSLSHLRDATTPTMVTDATATHSIMESCTVAPRRDWQHASPMNTKQVNRPTPKLGRCPVPNAYSAKTMNGYRFGASSAAFSTSGTVTPPSSQSWDAGIDMLLSPTRGLQYLKPAQTTNTTPVNCLCAVPETTGQNPECNRRSRSLWSSPPVLSDNSQENRHSDVWVWQPF